MSRRSVDSDLSRSTPSFGSDVKRVRTARKLTQHQLARATGYSEAYVSKVESGTQMPSTQFAEGCDRVFGTGGIFRDSLTRLMGVDHPAWFAPFAKLESTASSILDFSTYLIYGVLQTREYTQAILRAGQPTDAPEETAAKVDLRARRGKLLKSKSAPTIWAILDEACLQRVVGGQDVMRRQLEHLLSVDELPHVTLQVLPFNSGAPPADSSYTLLRFGERSNQRPVLYSEGQGIGRVIDSDQPVETAMELFERLRADALSPMASLRIIKDRVGELG